MLTRALRYPSKLFVTLVTLLTVVACAYQNAGAGTDDDGDDPVDEGGTSSGGAAAMAGKSSLPLAGTSTTSAGKSAGGSSGSGGKSSTGGSGGKGGKGGSAGTAGSADGAGGEDTGPVNMPIVGLSVTFKADSMADPVDFVGGELNVINETAQPLALADLKVRYYFSNEITAVSPTVMMNWAQFGPVSNLGGATCTGKIEAAGSPKPDADSYVELTCSGANGNDLTAGTLLRISWKAGAQGQGKLIQANDYSFTDPTKILVMNGNTIVWGIDPS